MKVERLDGDIVRKSLTQDLGFFEEDRNRNIERVTLNVLNNFITFHIF